MIKKDNKVVLYIIVILLIIFLPLTIYGTVLKFNAEETIDNPNKEFKFNNSLYFYENGNLLGIYECETETCDYAVSSPEEIFTLDVYENNKENLGIINSKYALISDNNKYILYDLENSMALANFESIKFYNSDVEGNILFAKNNGYYGVLSLDEIKLLVPYEYEYLGVKSNYEDNILQTDNILAKNEDGYVILDSANNMLSSAISDEIIDFNSIFLVSKDNVIYDYEGVEILTEYEKITLILHKNYIIFSDEEYVYIFDNEKNLVENYDNNGHTDITIKDDGNSIEIIVNNEVIGSI